MGFELSHVSLSALFIFFVADFSGVSVVECDLTSQKVRVVGDVSPSVCLEKLQKWVGYNHLGRSFKMWDSQSTNDWK